MMEEQVEKSMENEMKTWNVIWAIGRMYVVGFRLHGSGC